MSDPNSVERTSRQVIERKLLTALEAPGTVAILASKQDLEDMIAALEYGIKRSHPSRGERFKDLADGIKQLLKETFP